jgi:hypothetical protein
MRLDAAASRALNVLPHRLDGSASFSLYGIMARGKTAMGKRLLKVCTHPCVSPAEYALCSVVNASGFCVVTQRGCDVVASWQAMGKRLLEVRCIICLLVVTW